MQSNTLPQKAAAGALMDTRRKDMLASGAVRNHDGEVLVVSNPSFDINKTIFKTLDESLHELIRKQYGVLQFWSDSAVARVSQKAAEMLSGGGTEGDNRIKNQWASVKPVAKELLDFMHKECEFDCEHADGSFLDHLQFCYEYCHAHFPSGSSMVLFLHSIMGVGTNLFPMLLEQRPKLSSFLTQAELRHIECFPTMLRLLQTDLIPALDKMTTQQLDAINGIECHRLIGPDMRRNMRSDNKVLHLNRDEFWEHLNYQLIHFLDFLPASQWEERLSSGLFPSFMHTHSILKRAGKLLARVDFDSNQWLKRAKELENEESIQRMKNATRMFSAAVGHNLGFELLSKPRASL